MLTKNYQRIPKNPPNKTKTKPNHTKNPQSLSDQGRKTSPLLKQDCWLQFEFFSPCFYSKEKHGLCAPISIYFYQVLSKSRYSSLCCIQKYFKLLTCVYTVLSLSLSNGSGCFVHLQNTTPIYDENSSHSLGFSEPVNTTTILIKERNSTRIL